MNAISYYETEFAEDLLKVAGVDDIGGRNRVSLAGFMPGRNGKSLPHGRAFGQLEHKSLFLFCYFFTVLFDQSVHSSLPDIHPEFERLTQYPKLCGLLGSYWQLMHPCTLLLANAVQIAESEKSKATQDFEALSDFFVKDIELFFRNEFPRLSKEMQSEGEQEAALLSLFTEMHSSMSWMNVPKKLGSGFTSESPDLSVYEAWIRYWSAAVKGLLDSIEQAS